MKWGGAICQKRMQSMARLDGRGAGQLPKSSALISATQRKVPTVLLCSLLRGLEGYLSLAELPLNELSRKESIQE